MAQIVRVNVDNPDDLLRLYGAGALIRLERAATSAFTTPTEVGTQVLEATKTQYEFDDLAGTASDWYRTRFSNSGGTTFSPYSAVFQNGAPTAYATLESLRELLQLPDTSRDNLLVDLLRRVTDKINLSLGFDFFRHPAVSGTEIRYFDGGGSTVISLAQGFYSVSAVSLGSGTGATRTALTSSDYYLRSPVQDGGPYLELVLSDIAGHSEWYAGYQTVQVTGVFGYPSIPPAIEMATLYWAADLFRIGAYGGSQFSVLQGGGAGLEEFGQTRFAGGMPRITWETVEDYRARHKTWLVV